MYYIFFLINIIFALEVVGTDSYKHIQKSSPVQFVSLFAN